MNSILTEIINGFDPLYVDTRSEYEKKKDKKGTIIITCIMIAIIVISNILE